MNVTAPEQNRKVRTPESQVKPSGKSVIDAEVKSELADSLTAADGGSAASDDIIAAMKKDPLFAKWRNEEAMDPRKLKEKSNQGKDPFKADWRKTENADAKTTAEKIDDLKGQLDEDESGEKNNKKDEKPKAEDSKPKEEKTDKNEKSKKGKIVWNPLNWAWYAGKEAISGAVVVPTRILAKAAHIVSRPQQLFTTQMWSDVGTNVGNGIGNFFRTISGTVYRPHRTKLPYKNVFQDYGEGWGASQTKDPAKRFWWGFGKALAPVPFFAAPKFFAHGFQGVSHLIADTFTGKFDYTLTQQAFRKAFSRDYSLKSK